MVRTHSLLLFTLLLTPAFVLADGEYAEPNQYEQQQQGVQKVPAEDIDKRLPPVIPGQQVTAGGVKHKVISTAGPVPVNPAPRAPAVPRDNTNIGTVGGVGVIIDRNRNRD